MHALGRLPGDRPVHVVAMSRCAVADPQAFIAFQGTVPDIVIDLAWDKLDDYEHASHLHEQLPLHVEFCRVMASAGVRTLVGIGTAAEYGLVNGPLFESQAVAPVSRYAIAKDGMRVELQRLAGTFGFSWRWLRLFNVWGEGQPTRSLYGQITRLRDHNTHRVIIPAPDRVLDVLSVEEMASRIVNLALRAHIDGVINCGSGVGVSIRALVHDWLRESPACLSRVRWGNDAESNLPDGYWADTVLMDDALTPTRAVAKIASPAGSER
jgi:dTDP-6-deoxy-L-talose 4-dehydrogenase (NAD+)